MRRRIAAPPSFAGPMAAGPFIVAGDATAMRARIERVAAETDHDVPICASRRDVVFVPPLEWK